MIKYLIFAFMFSFTGCAKNEFEDRLSSATDNISLIKKFEMISILEVPFVLIGKDTENNHLKIRLFSLQAPNELSSKIKQIITLYTAQFEFTTAPYPGQITSATSCGVQYRPQFRNFKNLYYVKFYSNKRLGLAVCDSDNFKYYQYLFFLKDNSNHLLALDYYSVKNLNDEELYGQIHSIIKNPNLINISHD